MIKNHRKKGYYSLFVCCALFLKPLRGVNFIYR
jgi:hypothetical protein